MVLDSTFANCLWFLTFDVCAEPQRNGFWHTVIQAFPDEESLRSRMTYLASPFQSVYKGGAHNFKIYRGVEYDG